MLKRPPDIPFLEDKSFPWRFYNNFIYLLNHYENFIINNIEKFEFFINFFTETVDSYMKSFKIEKLNFVENPKTTKDLFVLNIFNISSKILERISF